MNRQGQVFYDGELCGIIEQNDDGFLFTYNQNWLINPKAKPISLTMPLIDKPYQSNVLFPFFDGLLPEGYLLELTIQRWGMARNDRMGILLKSCLDPIGIVSVKEISNE
ncbi:MAG: HipA N-terminal domain-containing protein [Bacilli bacterium]|nr:HipA N-terminal domain-containing protein [Bacilli bacterium]